MEKSIYKSLIQMIQKVQGIGNCFPESAKIEIELPRQEAFGDLSTPLAMTLSKILRRKPREIAEEIIKLIDNKHVFEKIEIAGPGFINFTFSRTFIAEKLAELLNNADDCLKTNIGSGRKIQIEFVSANPTGPLHLGHGRGAALGGALSNLLKETGYQVVNEYYINDAGRQVKLLGLSVYARYRQLEDESYPFPEDGYKGDYIFDLAAEFARTNTKNSHIQNIADEFAKNTNKELISSLDKDELIAAITDFSYKKMLEDIKTDLESFGVVFDVWQSEKELFQKTEDRQQTAEDSKTMQQHGSTRASADGTSEVKRAIDDLRERGYIYEKDGALWFSSTSFGDDKDRVIVKNDGEYTYFASDIAYHRHKIEQKYDELIDIWGADHHGYIPRINSVIEALGYPKEKLRVLLVQMVTLLRAGVPVQMSKRSGEFITLKEVMDEIGPDTTRFLFLTRRPDSQLEIDIEVAKSQSQENPVYYVQYAHARINSIFEKAKETGAVELGTDAVSGAGLHSVKLPDFDPALFNDEEMRLIKKLLIYPMILKNAAIAHEPHRITFYLQELAAMFHPYYHRNRVVSEDRELTVARLNICKAVQIVLRHGFQILGVNAPDRM
ncbi:MAG: arginine--tRNA ligase [Dissulfurispiraceae bacterium]|jgi:arginyl-tRNA synthetase|nr:arginine--tRNA ligase [Dissulfurispiraceae bacterium]